MYTAHYSMHGPEALLLSLHPLDGEMAEQFQDEGAMFSWNPLSREISAPWLHGLKLVGDPNVPALK
jgi:hypothetical protein